MRSLLARLVPLLAAAVVLLSLAVPERAHYFCRMMGQVVPACCCKGNQPSPAARETTVRPVDCCERIEASSHASVASLRDHANSVPPAALAVLPSFDPATPRAQVSVAVPALARAPPAIGPPLFIANCALLT